MTKDGTVIVLLGPPGAGKGTQAERLSASLGIPKISTGEMLRQECRSGSVLGEQIRGVLDAGSLVSDDLMQGLVAQRLAKADCRGGCILDGFPRTVAQANFLDGLLASLRLGEAVIFDFTISPEELIARLSFRRQCSTCGGTFRVAPGMEADCPTCNAPLYLRVDDQPATIRHRLRVYAEHTSDIVKHYQDREYKKINACMPAEDLTQKVLWVLSTIPRGTKDFKRPVLPTQHFCAQIP